MDIEKLGPDQIVEALLDAARSENWGIIDNKLVPQLSVIDGDYIATRLLGHVGDEDNNIRDVVATGLTALNIADEETLTQATQEMIKMATTDSRLYAAGRAATFLLKRKEVHEGAEKALETFKQRATQKGWQADLMKSIPALADFF